MKQTFSVLLLLLLAFPVMAEEITPRANEGQAQSEDTAADTTVAGTVVEKPLFRLKDDVETDGGARGSADIGGMILGLMAVLAIIFVLAWLSKRFNLNMPGANTNMKMLSAMNVGQKEKIILVEVEGRKMLLGVTPHQINLLQDFELPGSGERGREDNDKATKTSGEFAFRMQSLLKAGVSQHD